MNTLKNNELSLTVPSTDSSGITAIFTADIHSPDRIGIHLDDWDRYRMKGCFSVEQLKLFIKQVEEYSNE